jgi:Ca2+-binding RTX toxin-like protein
LLPQAGRRGCGIASSLDYVEGNAGNDIIDAGRLTQRIVIGGGEGSDTITGGAGDDALTGNGGDDTLRGGLGCDSCDLGTGVNTAYIDNGTAAGGDVVDGAAAGSDTVGQIAGNAALAHRAGVRHKPRDPVSTDLLGCRAGLP